MKSFEIINATSIELGERLGISLERRNYLAKELNAMVKDSKSGKLRIIYTTDIINQIRSFCETDQEYTWCLINHMSWLFKSGRTMQLYPKN